MGGKCSMLCGEKEIIQFVWWQNLKERYSLEVNNKNDLKEIQLRCVNLILLAQDRDQ
jgi:hypothetical protein